MRQSLSPELSQLINVHKMAFARFEATHEDDPAFIIASRAEDEARYDVAVRPCATDAEFLEKLRYLLNAERNLWGEPEFLTQFGSIVIAMEEHFDNYSG